MAMVAKKKRNEGRMKMNESFDFDSIFQFQIIRLVHKTVQIRVRYFLDYGVRMLATIHQTVYRIAE
jgi:hypothetical protein